MSTSSVTLRDNIEPAKVAKSLARYRVLAVITGVFLLILTAEMIWKYGLKQEDPTDGMIARIHGWIYVVYLLTVVDLWTNVRASWQRLATWIIAGVVPVLSFIIERKTSAEIQGLLNAKGDH